MKVKVIAVMISSILCGSAIASDSLTEAKNEVSKAESSYSQSETNYHNTAYEAGSGVIGSSAEIQMNQAASERAQAYANEYNAERQAEYNQKQAQKTAQEKDTQQPATVSPATVQAAKNASIQAGIDAANKANAVQTGKALTEANQHRTNAQAVAKADAIMNSYDHPVTPSKSFGDAQVKANRQRTEDQAVALADARMNEQDRQNKALGTATHKTNEQHEQPIHISASAHPAAAHAISSHLDRSPVDKEAAKAAQAHHASAQAQEVQSHSMRYSGMTKQPMATLTPSKPVETVKVDSKPHNSSINVSAGSLKPDTAVTVNGKPTTAGTLKPDTQVKVGIDSAFNHSPKGGTNHSEASTSGEHGTGTGSDNAHDHAFGGHTGAGGGFHY